MNKHRSTRPTTWLVALAVAMIASLAAAMGPAEAQLSTLPAGTTCFSFDEGGVGFGPTHASYLHTIVGPTSTTAATPSIIGNVESIAVRNDTGEIYAYDGGGFGGTDQLYAVDPATGAFSAPADYGLSSLGDVDAMFFVDDEDGDPTNDVLWVLVDPNVLAGFDITGAPVGVPITVAVPPGAGIDGATWLAEPAPGEFFVQYPQISSSTPSVLASLGTGTVPNATPVGIGTTEYDAEGLGTNGGDALYLTTGADGTDSLYSVTAAAAADLLVDLGLGAPSDGRDDFESVDCAQAAVTLSKTVTAGPIDNGDGTFGYEFTFVITNTGHVPLSNIILTDTYDFTLAGVTATDLASTNDCPAELLIDASCSYVDTVNLRGRAGVYNNEAAVEATGSFGQPVTADDDVDFTVPEYDVSDPDTPTDCAHPGSPVLPDPGVAATFLQSGSYNSAYDVSNAFDGAVGSKWLSPVWQSPAWFGVDLGSANATTYLVTSYDVSFSNGQLTSRAPRDWTLEGSNDGQSWTVLDTRTGQTNWLGTETRTFGVTQPQVFSAFRMRITQDNDSRSDIVVASIGELALYTKCP